MGFMALAKVHVTLNRLIKCGEYLHLKFCCIYRQCKHRTNDLVGVYTADGFILEACYNIICTASWISSLHGNVDNSKPDNNFSTYFGAIALKRMRRFDLLTTDLDNASVVCDLTQTTNA